MTLRVCDESKQDRQLYRKLNKQTVRRGWEMKWDGEERPIRENQENRLVNERVRNIK